MTDFHDLAGLKRISTIVSACQDTFQGSEQVLGILRSMLGCTAVGVWRFNDAALDFDLVASDPAEAVVSLRIPQTEALFETLSNPVQNGDEMITRLEGEPARLFTSAQHATVFVVPLVWRNEITGVLGVFGAANYDVAEGHRCDVLEIVAPLLAARITTERASSGVSPELGEEPKRLLHIQVAIRRMLEQPDVHISVAESVDAIQYLGWRRVILALFTPDLSVERIISAGVEDSDLDRYGEYLVPPEVWGLLMDGQLESLRRSGMYCLFADDELRPTWHAGDIVFGLLQAGQGEVIGLVRVDDPVNGQRPTNDALRAVDILANQTAYVIENARMIDRASQSAEALQYQVEELSMMHRADRELSTHLNVDRILRLTMDWSVRRTGAVAGVLMLIDDDHHGLVPSVTLGQIDYDKFPYSAANPLIIDESVIGLTAKTRQTQNILDLQALDESFAYFPTAHSVVSVPLAMRDEVLGVLVLGSSSDDGFSQSGLDFLELLVRRAVVALDNARLLKQSEQLADDMAVIYTASRTITSTLERGELLQRIAQVMTVALECSSAVIFDFQNELETVKVLAVYRLGTALDAPEVLPEIGESGTPERYPSMQRVIGQNRTAVVYDDDPTLSELDRARMKQDRIRAMVLVPLIAQNEMIGLAAVFEGRYERRFSPDDVFRIKTLSSQAAVALRQSMLHNEVRELEKLKSEMIRMASHDLRNPLNNIMGYVDLLDMTLEKEGITPEQRMFIDNLKTSTTAMHSLLEDMLTLERIESERQNDWRQFDFAGLVLEVCSEERSGADLKKQELVLERPEIRLPVYGNVRQMRQAMANMVGNAIKYTPEGGRVVVNVRLDGTRVRFQVADNGYGISPARQARIFERFYRAREPGTDHIPGTGLGLSLVKTVIERHGGEVWFASEHGHGSTFGFWVPKDEGIGVPQHLRN